MARMRSVYLPLDVDFFDNARVLEAGEKAAWLYLAMCCESKRRMSDGLLSRRQIAALQVTGWSSRMKQLVTAGLVSEIVEGQAWQIVGFLERNYSAEQISEARERDRWRKQDSRRSPDGQQMESERTLREVRDREEVREEVEVEAEGRQAQAEGQGRAAFIEMREALAKRRNSA